MPRRVSSWRLVCAVVVELGAVADHAQLHAAGFRSDGGRRSAHPVMGIEPTTHFIFPKKRPSPSLRDCPSRKSASGFHTSALGNSLTSKQAIKRKHLTFPGGGLGSGAVAQ